MEAEYIEAFVEESKSLLTDLNNLLLELEERPEDVDTMTSIFRIAHTLKGNSAAMGYDSLSELAHAVEDLLDALRLGKTKMDSQIMNLIFEGVDGIQVMLEEVFENGETTSDPSELISRIRGDLESRKEEIKLKVGINPKSQMKGIDAMLILKRIEDVAELVTTSPSTDEIEDGKFEEWIELVLKGSINELETVLKKMPQVTGFKLMDDPHTNPNSTIAEIEEEETKTIKEDKEEDNVKVKIEGKAVSLDKKLGEEEIKPPDVDPIKFENEIHPTRLEEADVDDQDEREIVSSKKGEKEKLKSSKTQKMVLNSNSTKKSISKTASSADKIKSIRISVHKLDELMNLVEELVIRKLKLENSLPEDIKKGIGGEFSAFDRIISRLQDTVMDLRLIPLKHVVDRLPRMVRDICKSLGKEVDFKIEGSDVTVDRTVLDKIQDPLIHMIRNSLDHGIELPEVREEIGKPRKGKIILSASKLKDHVLIEVTDDGKGLDPEVIKKKALEKGLIQEEQIDELTEEEIYNLILLPGFSTANKVSDISGRGVGTDIIQNTVKSLGGSVEVKSKKGEGTTFILRLPLSMAISQILLISIDGEKYGIPIKDIIEVKPASECQIRDTEGTNKLIFRDKIIPVVHLADVLEVSSAGKDNKRMVIVVSSLEKTLALTCDSVLAQKEVVIKSMGMLKSTKGISGISILGEGEVVLILDVNTLQEVNV